MTDRTTVADRLFVALDVPDLAAALTCARRLRPLGVRFKVGLELFCRVGPAGVLALQGVTGPLFLDLKLHDIPRTVRRAVSAIAGLGAWGVTLHAAGGPAMLRAGVEAAREAGGARRLRILAVTVLTSIDADLLAALGVGLPLPEQVRRLVALAVAAGCDGAVASAAEAGVVRAQAGPHFLVVTPGIRPEGAAWGDQARVATPRAAHAAGADLLVVGRPVTEASDPLAATEAILREMVGGG